MQRAIAICVFCLVLGAGAAEPIGRVIALQGQAEAAGADGKVRMLALKSEVYLNDRLLTRADSRLQIMLDDDSVISQGPAAEMVIDEYVYTPKKGGACAFKVTGGLVRMISGRISELNPERFKVKTRMATIGIRGCEVGFDVNQQREDVYILELPLNKQIYIETGTGFGGPGDFAGQMSSILVLNSGVAVAIMPGLSLKERPITAGDLQRLFNQTTPAFEASRRIDSLDSERNLQDGNILQEAIVVAEVKGQDSVNQTLQKEQEETLNEQRFPTTQFEPTDRPSLFDRPDEESTTPSSGPDASSTPPPGEAIPPPPGGGSGPGGGSLPPPPPSIVASGGGVGMGYDWEWGMWSSYTMSFFGNYLTTADFDAIRTGGTLYTLSGSGTAGAFAENMSGTKLLNGSAFLNISVGQGSPATWSGSWTLSNVDGDSASFAASGDITSGASGGQFSNASLLSYDMMVNGSSYPQGTLTTHTLNGYLVGSGVPPTPITGAVGDFVFNNSPDGRLYGVYGVNLSGPLP